MGAIFDSIRFLMIMIYPQRVFSLHFPHQLAVSYNSTPMPSYIKFYAEKNNNDDVLWNIYKESETVPPSLSMEIPSSTQVSPNHCKRPFCSLSPSTAN